MSELYLEDDFDFIVFSEIYQRFTLPKTRRKALAILETSISCYERCGFDGTTFKMIARESGVLPSTLRHYFTSLEEIEDYTVKYIHCTAQKIVVDAMKGTTDPLEQFKKYLNGHFVWATQYARHNYLWNSYTYYKSRSEAGRELNTEAILNGAKRISKMLAKGRKSGVFKHSEDFQTARLIQTIVSGWLTTLATENVDVPQKYTQQIFNHCVEILTNK